MTDREKLLDIINTRLAITGWITPDELVDLLIAHGVTVREPQKPLTVEKLECRMKCWYEENGKDELDYVMIGGSGYAIELYFIKLPYPMEKMRWEYGKTWRCWAEKPTEEERKAAEWV